MPRLPFVLALVLAVLTAGHTAARAAPSPARRPVVPSDMRRDADIASHVRAILAGFRGKPDDAKTWADARLAVDSYLHGLWRAGSLKGSKAPEAYLVSCGLGTTMTQNDLNLNVMILRYGVALVRPAEFAITVVRISL